MKSTKQQPSRKAAPRLSAEEELAELLSDPTLQPSISFLGIRPEPDTESVPGTEKVSGAVSVPGAELRNFNTLRPRIERGGGTSTASGIDSRPALVSVPDAALRPGLLKTSTPHYQKPKARRAVTVEDGHSHIEHHVYTTLWSSAEPHGEDSRILTMGFGTMSHLVRLSLNNCRLNVRSLVRKLAIEEFREEQCPQGVGKTYLIHGPDAVLRRRREAGLEWVIRTRGVVFVDPATDRPLEKES